MFKSQDQELKLRFRTMIFPPTVSEETVLTREGWRGWSSGRGMVYLSQNREDVLLTKGGFLETSRIRERTFRGGEVGLPTEKEKIPLPGLKREYVCIRTCICVYRGVYLI